LLFFFSFGFNIFLEPLSSVLKAKRALFFLL
jgi:hypothetical protein